MYFAIWRKKQRIAIARVLVMNPKIFMLDETTPGLDSLSGLIVQAALNRATRSRTTVKVAHQLSAISNIDIIFVAQKVTNLGFLNSVAVFVISDVTMLRYWQMYACIQLSYADAFSKSQILGFSI
ncbi:uncharacterized protein isoform X2 [Rhodnius prolixus]|uniref:uncharacterized protein isoform X2 n=1 Tax=Rhodnius prolixus TaxID=13249 RepID=UPI003D18D7A3